MVSHRCSEKFNLAQEAFVLSLQTSGGLVTSSEELLYYMLPSLNHTICCLSRFMGVTGDWILKSVDGSSETFFHCLGDLYV